MSRNYKKKKTESLKEGIGVEEKKVSDKKVVIEPKRVQLKRALSVWRKRNPQRAMLVEDVEAVELFVKKYIPGLNATQDEFNKVLEKF